MSIQYYDSWLRLDGYQLREEKSGLCVCPAPGADEHSYHPFDQSDSILFDFSHMGWLESRGALPSQLVLAFVQQYGMLGFLTSVIQKEYDDGSVKLRRTNFVTQAKALTAQEYFSIFLPGVENYSKYFGTAEQVPVSTLMTWWQPEKQWYVLNRSDYVEQISWVAAFALHLYRLAELAQCGGAFDYELGNIIGALTAKDEMLPIMTWRFDSLKSAIDIMLVTELTAQRRTLKLCKHCGQVFRLSNPKGAYCGPKCRNTANVKLSRQHKREAQKKLQS